MGKKYIVELKEGERLYITTLNALNEPVIRAITYKPYSDLDLEQVRKEAYKEGREAGIKDGMCDAWEAARFIADMPYGEEEKAFGSGGWAFIVKHTASEAIEKIRQYEQEKEEIKVGDEVITASGKAVVTGVGPVHFEYFNADGSSGDDEVKNVKKTGRTFPEIAEVLRKMRENNG